MTIASSAVPVASRVIAGVTPEKLRSWPKAADPVRMISTMTEIDVAAPSAFFVTFQLSRP